MKTISLIFLNAFLAGMPFALGDVVSSSNDLELLVGQSAEITLTTTSPLPKDVSLNYTSNNGRVVNVSIEKGGTGPPWKILLEGISLGHDTVSFFITPNITDVSEAFVRVTVMRSSDLALTSAIVGWIYFVAWSVSFYPQVYENWRRKSVVGLNFDFVYLNIIGFSLYSAFNCALYWIPTVQAEYFSIHEKGLNPVQLNDIFFSLHAVLFTSITLLQCWIYERGGQTVSLVARFIIGTFFSIIIISLGLTVFSTYVTWLTFFSICAYLKLVTTLIKYVPQAFMNYKRKSTVGWSIGNVVLDFTGGILSMLQMIINADNYDDWGSIFGDPTKFGLGFFSVLFDIFFLVQHYILYRIPAYELITGEDNPDLVVPTPEPNGSGRNSTSSSHSGNYGSLTTEPITSNPRVSSETSVESPLSDTTETTRNTGEKVEQTDPSLVSC